MLEILKSLKETPLPIVLVIGGLAFLFFSLIKTAKVKEFEFESSNKFIAGIIGFILLVVGIGLYIIPFGTAASTLPTTIPSSITSVTETPKIESTLQVSQPIETFTPIPQPTAILYNGWVLCWHGRDGYEYLIAYPESDVKQGVSLNFNLTNAQGRQVEVANDSLKMCYVDGEWYGYPDPNPWFPTVSYMKLLNREIQVCSDSPGCQGKQFMMIPENYYPWNSPELQAPKETGIHIIAYKSSK